jgi:hypothetical protein
LGFTTAGHAFLEYRTGQQILTPKQRVLEELSVAELINKFYIYHKISEVHCRVYKSPEKHAFYARPNKFTLKYIVVTF